MELMISPLFSHPSRNGLYCSLVCTLVARLGFPLTYCQLPDEFLPVRIVLRLSDCSDTTLKHYLPRLEVKLDVFAVDPAESVGENPTPTRDIIFSGIVGGDEDPLVIFNEFEGDEGSGNHVYLVWNIETILRESIERFWWNNME
jgi:hypothetical protein